MDAVWVVRFPGSRAEPHIVIELGWNPLGLQIDSAAALFPVKAVCNIDCHLRRPAKNPVLDQHFDRSYRRSETVELALKTEPGVEPEDRVIAPNRVYHLLALCNGPGHRLLTPDIFTSVGGIHLHLAVPVRRSDDVYNVHILLLQQFSVVAVPPGTRGGSSKGLVKVPLICVTDSDQTGPGIPHVASSHGTDTDYPLRQLITWSGISHPSQYVTR